MTDDYMHTQGHMGWIAAAVMEATANAWSTALMTRAAVQTVHAHALDYTFIDLYAKYLLACKS